MMLCQNKLNAKSPKANNSSRGFDGRADISTLIFQEA